MKPTRRDRIQDFWMWWLRPLVNIWMLFDTRTTYIFDESFNRKRKEPYILLGNHTFMFDVVHVPLRLKKVPFMIASHNLFIRQPTKFLFTKIVHAIPKTKNASDIRAAREILKAVKRQYPIMIFPEGNTTFNGETTYIEESTMKLIKKLKIDVVTVLVQGGYLSKPRWATSKRKNRRCKIFFKVAIKAEDIKNMSLDEISNVINTELYNNDYEYQRSVMIPHPGKKLAEGIENVLYICPECEHFGTLEAHGNTLECTNCNTVGAINQYGFIEGFKFDNTVDWDKWQRKYDNQLINEVMKSPCNTLIYDDDTFTFEHLGRGTITCKDRQFMIEGEHNQTFSFDDIKTTTVFLRRNFSFYVDDIHYIVQIDKYVSSFLRAIQSKY